MKSTIIIGAGITGLTIARRLREAGVTSVTVLEKSSGVGGRMATRRSDDAKFDHGAQFYSLKPPMAAWHARWQQASLVRSWFERDGVEKFAAPGGMTSLAKNLAEDLEVRLHEKAVSLRSNGQGWKVETEAGRSFAAEQVVLTCPLPQALALLERSDIEYADAYSKMRYAKSLVALIENPSEGTLLTPGEDYRENPAPDIFSVANQRSKDLSAVESWTITMSAEFSEAHFDRSDDEILRVILTSLARVGGPQRFSKIQLKKWRYAQPIDIAPQKFLSPAANVYVAGDAFARPSLNGAVESATAVLNQLLR